MLIVKPTQDIELIKEIITSHSLYEALTGGSGMPKEDWTPIAGHTYLAIYNEDAVYGLYDVYPFTETTYFVHSAVLPKYWGTGIAAKAALAGEQYLADQGVLKLLTPVPVSLRPVRNHVERVGFKLEGLIEKGMIYNNKETDVCMYGKYIKRGNR